MQALKLSALALAAALAAGGSIAQTSGAAASGNTGSSVTGGRSAPAAQATEGTQKKPSTKDDKVASADRKFIEKAAGGGMFEVQVGQLATTRAKDPEVKKFAERLVADHTKANDELTQLANAKGVELPAAPPHAMRKEIENLGKKQGDEFDKDFIKMVGMKDHEKDIKDFEKASKDAKDPELKAWAAKTLPTLKEHLAMAQQIGKGGKGDAASMGASGSKAGAAGTGDHSGASTKTGGGNGANKTGS